MPVLTLNPSKDSHVYEGNASANYGSNTELKLGKDINHKYYNVAIQFDLASVPKGITVNSAKIKLYISSVLGTDTLNGMLISTFKSDWQENVITKDNMPSYDIKYVLDYQGLNSSDANTWIERDITTVVKSWLEGTTTNYGLYVDAYPGGASYDQGVLNIPSRENADTTKRPQLVIDYSLIPPSQPSNLSPTGGQVLDRAILNRLSWQHNPASPSDQIGFELQWRKQGETVWNTISQTTKNQYWDVPVNTFPSGYIEWQVRTTDINNQVSSYPTISVFKASEKPLIPVITSPVNGSKIAGGKLTVQWTSLEQVEYNLKLLDANSNTLWQDTRLSTDKIKTAVYVLANNTSYKIQLRVKNADGLWSNYAESNISVVYTTVPPPVVSITQDAVRGSLKLDVTNDEAGIPKKVKVGLKGGTVINLLGNAGDCEDISKFTTMAGGILQLDSTNKVFGNNSIKLTQSSVGAWTSMNIDITKIIDKTKYYCLSGYLKNGNYDSVFNVLIQKADGAGIKSSPMILDKTKFVRTFVKLQPSDLVEATYVGVGTGTTTVGAFYGYVDGLMLEEITQSEYNNPSYQPSPFVNSDTSVVNPVIQSKDSTGQVISTVTVPYTLRECLVEDEITQDGKLIQNVGYKVMDGNLPWINDYKTTDYHCVKLDKYFTNKLNNSLPLCLKYNNKILANEEITAGSDRIAISWWQADGSVLISIPNTDSGWGDAYTPTTDEIKAYFMGWKMYEKDSTKDYNRTDGLGKAWYPIGRSDLWTDILPTTMASGNNYTPHRLYYQLATPIITNINPIEISYIENGTVEVTSEVIPEYTLSAPLPVSYTNEVFRRKQGEINWLRLVKGLKGNTPYFDYTPQHKHLYEYKVRTILDTLAYSDSNVTLASVELKNSQIALPSDYSKWLELKINPNKKQSKRFERTQMLFAGRLNPVSEYSEHEELDIAMSFEVTEDELNPLDEILSSKQTILFRDSRGRRIFGTVEGYELEDIIPEDYIVSFTISKVSYLEGV